MVSYHPNQTSAPVRSCHSVVWWQDKFSEEVEAAVSTGLRPKHLFFFCQLRIQRCSALSFLFNWPQLRRVSTLFPGWSLVSQRKCSKKMALQPLNYPSCLQRNGQKFISAKSFFCSEKGPCRTTAHPVPSPTVILCFLAVSPPGDVLRFQF